MEKYVPAVSTQNVMPVIITRRNANFHPSIWGDYFLSYSSYSKEEMSVESEQQHKQLKGEVKKMLVEAAADDDDKASQLQLKLIDAMQRLGVSYHFESEIDAALQHLYDNNNCQEEEDDCDDKADEDHHLYSVALRFRLLRQHGHKISSGVFKKFTVDEGKFQKSLITNVEGLLSLYEATHLRVHGEDILDEALEFTTTHLNSLLPDLRNSLAAQVSKALFRPIRRSLSRLESRLFIPIYQQDNSHNPILLNFAKLDFNLLQKVHQRELSSISRWWKDLDFPRKLPFARDRVVECYFWISGVYFEPQYSIGRRLLTKVISITSIVDDIYDVYGTLEELELFTDAMDRLDISAIDQLPEYMRLCYHALLDVYREMDEEMAKEGRSFCVHYAKAEMKKLTKAYFKEAKWCNKGYTPTMEEYMKVALVTGSYMMLSTTSFVGMGELANKEAFDWVSSEPLIVRASSVVCRLTDDMVGHEFEQERGHVASAVECYMKQHGASKQEACDELNKQVTDAWKDINQEFLRPTAVPMPLLIRVLNFARVIDVLYKEDDGYTHSKNRVEKYITSVLIEAVPPT